VRLIAMLGACVALGLLAAPSAGAADWTTPLALSVADPSTGSPEVALDPQGDAVAVWSRLSGVNYIVQAALRLAGSGTWQSAVDLSAAGQNALAPQVALDAQGNAIVVWNRGGTVQAAVRPVGGGWQPALDISAAGSGNPQIAIDPQGNALVLWERRGATTTTVQAASRPAASGVWQPAIDISAAAPNSMTATNPQVAFDAQGNAIAVWSLSNGAVNIVQAALRPAGGAWQMASPLSAIGANAAEAQIAFDAQGNAIAVWARGTGANLTVQAAVRPAAGGTWGTSVDLSAAGVMSNQPRIVFDAKGTAFVIWETLAGGTYVIQATERPAATGTWLTPALNLSVSGHSAVQPALAINGTGDALALWSRNDGAHDIVQAALRSAAIGAWGAPKDISPAADNGRVPQLAFDALGNAVAVWQHVTATADVQAAAYDATGPLLESLSIPASGTAGQPVAFSVAPRDAWSALGATSWSFGDGTSAPAASVSHTYAKPGTFAVGVTGTDLLGNATLATGSIVIAVAPVVVVPPAQLSITAASLSRTRFRASGKHATKSKVPIGTQVRVTLSAAARLTLTFTAVRPGLRSGRKCVAPTAKLRKRHAGRCTRTLTLGKIQRGSAGRGRTVIAFNGHVAGKRLAAGTYSVRLTAVPGAGNSAVRTLRFTIVA
jgi:hypothetical protein